MSNTADVTPYANDHEAALPAPSVDTNSSFCASTETEDAAIARHDERKCQERIMVTRVSLQNSNAEGLLRAAQALGFTPVKGLHLPHCDFMTQVELRNAKGQNIALHLVGHKLDVSSSSGRSVIHDVVRRCTLDNARPYLEALGGGRMTMRSFANGAQRASCSLQQSASRRPGRRRSDIAEAHPARCHR